LNDARPTRHVVQNLVDGAVGDDVEEVVAIDQVAQRSANKIEVWAGGCMAAYFGFVIGELRIVGLLTE
jgi:hypothetical protein